MKKKIRLIPFLLILAITIFSWYQILMGYYVATNIIIWGLVLVILNTIFYFINFRYAIYTTGVLLIIATFNVISFFTVIVTNHFTIGFADKEIDTPEIQLWSLLILILFFAINGKFIINSLKNNPK